MDEQAWTLTLPSDLRLLLIVRSFVEAVCQIGGFDQASTDHIVLATNEAAHNVIEHAHHNDPSSYLQIHCHLGPDRIEVQLLDEGEPFDPAAVPQLNPSELRLGGRGLFLMRTLMDEISCQPRGDKGNTLRMVKRCARPGPGRDAC